MISRRLLFFSGLIIILAAVIWWFGFSRQTVQAPKPEGTTVKLYFFNEKIRPVEDCSEVVAVARLIPKTATPATDALALLLRGPTTEERAAGFSTNIPAGAGLNSLSITNGVAQADFNAATETGGGACHMRALTTQLRETLLQFPTVREVVLSVNGRVDDAFQP